MSLEYVIVTYAVLILFNTILSFLFFRSHKSEISYKYNFLLWVGTVLTLIGQGALEAKQDLLPFAYAASAVSTLALSKLLTHITAIKEYIRVYLAVMAAALGLATLISLSTDSFSAVAFPICAAVVLPIVDPLYRLRGHFRGTSHTTSFKLLYALSFCLTIHMLLYSVLRTHAELAPYGFILASFLCLGLGYVIPVGIAETLRQDYTLNLEKKVEEKTSELNSKNDILEKLLEDNRNLLRVTCHDISNPLTIVLAGCSVLQMKLKNGDRPDLEELVGKIHRSANIQKDLIERIKSQEAYSSGKKQLDIKPLDLGTLIGQCHFVFEQKLAEKNLELIFQNDLQANARILADEVIFGNNILNNIVSNAIKFSYPNSKIHIVASHIGKSMVEVKIQDSGIGMDPELLSHIFVVNKKTSRPGTQGEEGTGFGMPIVRKYIELLGGKIFVESKDIQAHPSDHGTIFRILMKCDVSAAS